MRIADCTSLDWLSHELEIFDLERHRSLFLKERSHFTVAFFTKYQNSFSHKSVESF